MADLDLDRFLTIVVHTMHNIKTHYYNATLTISAGLSILQKQLFIITFGNTHLYSVNVVVNLYKKFSKFVLLPCLRPRKVPGCKKKTSAG